jgi:hypothetical protein
MEMPELWISLRGLWLVFAFNLCINAIGAHDSMNSALTTFNMKVFF